VNQLIHGVDRSSSSSCSSSSIMHNNQFMDVAWYLPVWHLPVLVVFYTEQHPDRMYIYLNNALLKI
jgi:hypothetical protein